MNKRGAGVSFIFIAALLYCTQYLTAAFFGSGVMSWSEDLFGRMLVYVGTSLSDWSLVALVVGIAYLVWAELESIRESKVKKSED